MAAVDVLRRENKHTRWWTQRATKHDVRQNCANVYALLSKKIIISLLLTCNERWQHTFHMKLAGNNSFWITHAKSLHILGSLTDHGRTLKNHMGVALNLLTQYEEDVNDLLENNYQWWKLDPRLRAIKKLSEHSLEKKEEEVQGKFKNQQSTGQWC